MKKNFILSVIFSLLCLTTAFAQPAPVKKAAKSMFKLTTFDEEGKVLNTGYGAFVSTDGECLSTWTPFVGASSATVIDAQGRKYDVDCLIGANEIYNVSKFRVKVSDDKKMIITPMSIASSAIEAGGESWLVSYDVKNPTAKKYTPAKVETFQDNLPYYIYEQTANDEMAGCPFLNPMGELIGLMEPAKKRTDIYCASSQYAMKMEPSGLTANEATMRQTNIRIALPKDKNQALLALVMLQNYMQSPKFLAASDEFISLFPTAYEGYNAKAEYLTNMGNFEEANTVMEECVEKSEQKDEAHYAFSRIIFNKASFSTDSTFTKWNYDMAMKEIDAAYAVNPLPIYSMHKAKILYAQKKYKESYDTFIDVSKTNMRSGECFYDAALCLQALNEPNDKVLALLDSAVACYQEPYRQDAAPYLLIRARHYDNIGQARKALGDMLSYEKALNGRCSADFFYEREQVGLRAKSYQTALNDIAHAAAIAPHEETYLAELALLNVKLNRLDEGEAFSKLCMERFPEYGDGFAIHGLALITKGNKKEGMTFLEKAKEMGSPMAEPLIEKYSK